MATSEKNRDVQSNALPTSSNSDSSTLGSRPLDIESSFAAWTCVLGAFLLLLSSFGVMQSIGVFQSYLQLNQLQDYSAGSVGWITGTYMFLTMLASIQVGPLLDHYGPRALSLVGSGTLIVMFLLLAECQTYLQFMLCFGVFGGLASSINSTIGMSVVGKLFMRKRGLALGLAMSGSSIGSVIFPIMLRSLFPRLQWAWSMRVLAFTILGIATPGTLCLLPYGRLMQSISPLHQSKPKQRGALLNFSAFYSPTFSLLSVVYFTVQFGTYAVAGLLPAFATQAGLPADTGYIFLAIIGGTSAVTRVLSGLIGDRIGHFNVLLITIALTLLILGAMFIPFGKTGIVLYVFSGLWGSCAGAFLSTTPVCVGKTCEPKDYGRYYGTASFVISFAVLTSIPSGGTMLEKMGSQALGGFLIAVLGIGWVCLFAARALLIGKWTSIRTVV